MRPALLILDGSAVVPYLMKGFSPCDEQRMTLDEDTVRRTMDACDTACIKVIESAYQQHGADHQNIRFHAGERTSSGLPLKGWAKRMLSHLNCRWLQCSCRKELLMVGNP